MISNSPILLTCVVLSTISGACAQIQHVPDERVEGRQIFSSSCAGCHGLDGTGGEHAPSIATNAGTQQKTNSELVKIIRGGIPGAGMPAFNQLLNEPQTHAVLSYLRTLQGKEELSSGTGVTGQGRAVFFGVGRCFECHMMKGQGGFLGADLSGYGETHSADKIREWIVNPNKNADARHGTATIFTKVGMKYRGLIRNEDNFSLQMLTLDGDFQNFDKAELARIEREPKSLMPADYGEKLSASQLDDLVSFLLKATGTKESKVESDEEQ